MKVRVTYEIDDTDRIAISVAQGLGFKPASRESIMDYLASVTFADLTMLRRKFELAMSKINFFESAEEEGDETEGEAVDENG